MRAQDIVAAARETLGTRYAHQGRVAGLALDCAGVPVHVARTLGVPLTDYTRYGRLPVPAEMRAALDAHLTRVPTAQMQPGDVAWIRFEREPQHLAIVGDYVHGGLSLIHAYNASGLNRVVEHRLDDVWRSRIVAAWRYPGVER
jgi:cell wall-associated NlpC family hydrolase